MARGFFDAIFIPFNSIHVLYTNLDFIRAVESIKKHLNKNGYFLFDYFNPNIGYISENENKISKIKEYQTNDNRNVVVYQNMKYGK